MVDDKADKTLGLIKLRGPSLPVDVAKHIGTNTLLASAVLSELVSSGRLKISSVKVGGSPLYYVPGQESQLHKYTSYLHEKEQKAYELLKEKKIIEDRSQPAVVRVALRQIKDFAFPVTANIDGINVLFWRFQGVPMEEAEKIFFGQNLPTKSQEKIPSENILPISNVAEIKITEAKKTNIPDPSQEKKQETVLHSQTKQLLSATKPNTEKTESSRVISTNSLDSAENFIIKINIDEKPSTVNKPESKHVSEKKLSAHKNETQEKLSSNQAKDVSSPLVKGLAPGQTSEFLDELNAFFKKNNIIILETIVIKKKSEIDFVLKIPSPIGELLYYCKAKDKKKSTDADLSTAYVQGQARKLPTLYLSTGDLAKKAEEMLLAEFRGMAVKSIR